MILLLVVGLSSRSYSRPWWGDRLSQGALVIDFAPNLAHS